MKPMKKDNSTTVLERLTIVNLENENTDYLYGITPFNVNYYPVKIKAVRSAVEEITGFESNLYICGDFTPEMLADIRVALEVSEAIIDGLYRKHFGNDFTHSLDLPCRCNKEFTAALQALTGLSIKKRKTKAKKKTNKTTTKKKATKKKS